MPPKDALQISSLWDHRHTPTTPPALSGALTMSWGCLQGEARDGSSRGLDEEQGQLG